MFFESWPSGNYAVLFNYSASYYGTNYVSETLEQFLYPSKLYSPTPGVGILCLFSWNLLVVGIVPNCMGLFKTLDASYLC